MSVEELAVQLVATREKIRASRALYSVCKKLALRRSCIVFFFGAIRRSVFVCVCVCFGFGCLCVAAAWLFSGGAWWRCRFRSFSHSASRLLSARWRGPLLEFRNTVVAAHKLFVVAVRCHHLLWKQRRQGYSATQARTLAIDSFFFPFHLASAVKVNSLIVASCRVIRQEMFSKAALGIV